MESALQFHFGNGRLVDFIRAISQAEDPSPSKELRQRMVIAESCCPKSLKAGKKEAKKQQYLKNGMIYCVARQIRSQDNVCVDPDGGSFFLHRVCFALHFMDALWQRSFHLLLLHGCMAHSFFLFFCYNIMAL